MYTCYKTKLNNQVVNNFAFVYTGVLRYCTMKILSKDFYVLTLYKSFIHVNNPNVKTQWYYFPSEMLLWWQHRHYFMAA